MIVNKAVNSLDKLIHIYRCYYLCLYTSMQMRLTSLDILLLPMMLTSSGNGDIGFRHVEKPADFEEKIEIGLKRQNGIKS